MGHADLYPLPTGQPQSPPALICTGVRHAKSWGKLPLRTACFTVELMTYFVVRKITDESDVRKEGRVYFDPQLERGSLLWGRSRGRTVRQLVTLSPESGNRDTNACRSSPFFLSFTQSETPVPQAHRMVLGNNHIQKGSLQLS